MPRLFDAGTLYRSMGLLVGPKPLPFIASVRYLADSSPDSTLALLALSLANHALSFRRDSAGFVAEYRVEVIFQRDTVTLRRVGRDEAVRVHAFTETLRSDESVIFQQFLAVPPGVSTVRVAVRDRNGPAYAAAERLDTVPTFRGPSLGSPLAIYEGPGRARLDVLPQLVTNPRATLPYGTDSVRFYVEGYGLPPGTRLLARVTDRDSVEVWRDTVALSGGDGLASAQFDVQGSGLPLGQATMTVAAIGAPARAAAPLLVSLSDQWATTNFDQMLSMLRYFDRQDLVARLRAAPPERRAEAWRAFYRATDPIPVTPENEALNDYFRRLEAANERFQEPDLPGWLSDRGEVFITLGEPDEVYETGPEASGGGVRMIRWEFTNLRLTLYFLDETGFGQYRLSPASRSEYERVLAGVRRRQ